VIEHEIFPRSELLLQNVIEIIDRPLFAHSPRIATSGNLCQISIEHACAFRSLAESRMLASAFVVMRAQYEAVLRGVWALYSATDAQIERISARVTPDTELAAKNLPSAFDMLEALAKAPNAKVPFDALSEFKASAWPALNSYVHGGIHPLGRLVEGYPLELIIGTVRIGNALSMVAAMQYCVLTGVSDLQRQLTPLHSRFQDCLPLHRAQS